MPHLYFIHPNTTRLKPVEDLIQFEWLEMGVCGSSWPPAFKAYRPVPWKKKKRLTLKNSTFTAMTPLRRSGFLQINMHMCFAHEPNYAYFHQSNWTHLRCCSRSGGNGCRCSKVAARGLCLCLCLRGVPLPLGQRCWVLKASHSTIPPHHGK